MFSIFRLDVIISFSTSLITEDSKISKLFDILLWATTIGQTNDIVKNIIVAIAIPL
jgi:hypothetical protein